MLMTCPYCGGDVAGLMHDAENGCGFEDRAYKFMAEACWVPRIAHYDFKILCRLFREAYEAGVEKGRRGT